MKRPSVIVCATLVLNGAAALIVISDVALAKAPLQPVQHVYPDSTYVEIQQAIDNGGTVYFHRVTRRTNQSGEYDQIASSTPNLAPTPAEALNRGFFIGRNGKDVEIIGVLGPDGERPKINGGTLVFRVGVFPDMGVYGLPVNFAIENLELFNPDMAYPAALYSRLGVWVVGQLGSHSRINNCKITIAGAETDPGYAINHSVGMMFYLVDIPQPHPSGALIDITNNTIIASGVHEGIHVSSYWPEMPGFTPPRVFIHNNKLNLRKLGGFPNRGGTDGATVGSGIIVAGNLSGAIVTNNALVGDGRSPGLHPRVESVGIRVGRLGTVVAGPAYQYIGYGTVVGNDLSSFVSDFQLRVGPNVSSSTVDRNSFGPASLAGVVVEGQDNSFVNNHFYGRYPGWTSSASGPGLFWFAPGSRGNTVNATKLNGPPHGSDICGQVLDESGRANEIRGYEKCETR